MTKGADSIMLPRIDFDRSSNQAHSEKHAQVMQDLLSFAREGLRTLVLA